MAFFQPRIGFCVVCHPLEVGANRVPAILKEFSAKIAELPLEVILSTSPVDSRPLAAKAGHLFREKTVDLVVVLLATWTSDDLLLEILAQNDIPIINWGLPDIHAGSLCGAQQFNCVLKELGKTAFFLFDSTPATYQKLLVLCRAAALRQRMKTLVFGQVGNRIPGMMEVAFDEHSLLEVLGPRVMRVGLPTLLGWTEEISDKDAQVEWQRIRGLAGKVSVPDTEGVRATKILLAIKVWVKRDGLAGFCGECYPHYLGWFCLACSLLSGAEEGLVAGGCEGDVNSTVLMWAMMQLAHDPVHNADFLHVYPEDNSLLFSHCGSGHVSLAADPSQVEFAPVRLAESGMCVLFPGKTGPVTLANLVGRKGTYRLGILFGEAIETGMDFPGNPTRVRLPFPSQHFLDLVADHGLGHHWIIGYGDVAAELEAWAALAGINAIRFS